ncbi:MAG: type II toxin-antitoxin system VapC family toxin [Acidobacteria bacterium]|nr:type II toxin-antitoxin system VapC family toxin [Acidobacteriota bacterium]
MTRVVVDASALAALVFQEPEAASIRDRLDGATVFAPSLLQYELANVAWKKARRHPADAVRILGALSVALDGDWGLTWREVAAADVVMLAAATGLTSYDASYLWLAGMLGADLVTLDARIAEASARLTA